QDRPRPRARPKRPRDAQGPFFHIIGIAARSLPDPVELAPGTADPTFPSMRAFLVTRLQARKLPRWALLLLCGLYVLPGFIGRDPWRVDDAAGFGIALTMARGGPLDWLVPNIAGMWVVDEGGPLPFVFAALVARAFAFLAPMHLSARLASAAGLALTLVAFWYASYALSRRPGLQPPDPLGAGASRTDFGRAIADSGLLVLLACIGLITRMHETTAAAGQVGLVTMFLFGAA